MGGGPSPTTFFLDRTTIGVPACSGNDAPLYCPSSATSFTVSNTGHNGTAAMWITRDVPQALWSAVAAATAFPGSRCRCVMAAVVDLALVQGCNSRVKWLRERKAVAAAIALQSGLCPRRNLSASAKTTRYRL